MKVKRNLGYICSIVIFLIYIISCKNDFISPPILNPDTNTNVQLVAPKNIKASTGDKKSITLSWDSIINSSAYYIYKSDSPLLEFVRCATITNGLTEYIFTVQAGATVYYKVSAVNKQGIESPLSVYVKGTSLAQPVINDIILNTDTTEDSATVYWYMNNLDETTYKEYVRYIVYCFEDNVEKQQIALDGSKINKTQVTFYSLHANTNYTYQVVAYLVGDQNATEISEKMDLLTARRLKPQAPLNLTASNGMDVSKITLSFELPEMVDIMVDKNTFESRPLYFTISRRESGTENQFQIICPYFGLDATTATAKGNNSSTFADYTQGTMVSWVDTSIVSNNRGVEYEYKVQSYVDRVSKIISSETSLANTVGWAMKKPSVSIQVPQYTLNNDATEYKNATLSIKFVHEHKNVDYTYVLHEIIAPIGDGHPNDGTQSVTNDYQLNYEQITSYKSIIDLTQAASTSSRGRGLYSYLVDVFKDNVKIETISTIGSRRVAENTDPIIVENFIVKDGYADKYVFSWSRYSDKKYVLSYSNTGSDPWTEIQTFDAGYENDGDIFKYEYTDVDNKDICYFSIYAKNTQDVKGDVIYSPEVKKLGNVELDIIDFISYDTVKLTWNQVQMADTYRIKYKYIENKVIDIISSDSLTIDSVTNKYVYDFKPEGYNNALYAGSSIDIQVEALNKSREHLNDDGIEIKTTSQVKNTKLLGFVELLPSISKADSFDEIILNWKSIQGAQGYYIVRRQFNMEDNTALGNEVMYYYDVATKKLKGKELVVVSGIKEDSILNSSLIAYDVGSSLYTFKDVYLNDADYTVYKSNNYVETYINEQNDIAWGYPYRYYIVPVISENHVPAFSYNGVVTCTVSSVTYNNIASYEQTGFTVGFAQNIQATKGTSAITIGSEAINDGIRISWKKPAQLSNDKNPTYYIYRKLQTLSNDSANWISIGETGNLYYDDTLAKSTPPQEGKAYEYLVGVTTSKLSSSTQPQKNIRFIDYCHTVIDDTFNDEYKMTGFIIPKPEILSVSRTEHGNEIDGYYEVVEWKAAGVDSNVSTSKKRGIAGYEIQVLNKNIDNDWHTIDEISTENASTMSKFQKNIKNKDNLLKVLRDYKHYFRVRAYALDGDTKVYSKAPDYTWSDGNENAYVKWGARQITPEEFARIASLSLSYGVELVNGTGWYTAYDGWPNFSRTETSPSPGSGTVYAGSNFGVTDWNIKYTNYKKAWKTRGGNTVIFVSINGTLKAKTGASNQYPQSYENNGGFITVTGPSDISLYSGYIKYSGLKKDSSQGIIVKYPETSSTEVKFGNKNNTPFPFTGHDYLNNSEEWK